MILFVKMLFNHIPKKKLTGRFCLSQVILLEDDKSKQHGFAVLISSQYFSVCMYVCIDLLDLFLDLAHTVHDHNI